jgi:uncharacterized protein (DUF2147 family)
LSIYAIDSALQMRVAVISQTLLVTSFASSLALAEPYGIEDVAKSSFWLNAEQGWVVEAHLCGAELCSRLVGFRMVHPHAPGYVPLDDNNTDSRLRGRPLCGVQILGGFDPAKRKNNRLEGGWVYDPETGRTYSAILTLVDGNTVKLRGYIGIPLFGKTVTLHREASATDLCQPS